MLAAALPHHPLSQALNLFVRLRVCYAFHLRDGAEALREVEAHASRGEICDPLRQRFKLSGSVYVVARRVHACRKRRL